MGDDIYGKMSEKEVKLNILPGDKKFWCLEYLRYLGRNELTGGKKGVMSDNAKQGISKKMSGKTDKSSKRAKTSVKSK